MTSTKACNKRQLLRIASPGLAIWILGFLCCRAIGASVTLAPVAAGGLRVFTNVPPFVLGFSSVIGYEAAQGLEDRAIIDFNLSSFQTTSPISDAMLTLGVQNQKNGVQPAMTLDLFTFSGESTVQATDWDQGTLNQSFGVVNVTEETYNLDLTSAVEAALDAGQTFLDLRISTPTDDSPALLLNSPSLTVSGPTVSVPPPTVAESNDLALPSCGLLLAFFVWRQRQKGDTSSQIIATTRA